MNFYLRVEMATRFFVKSSEKGCTLSPSQEVEIREASTPLEMR